MQKPLATRKIESQCHPPVPHFDDGGLQACPAEKRRIRLQSFEIAANRNRFREHGAVIENERRYPLQWIDRSIGRAVVVRSPGLSPAWREPDGPFPPDTPNAA